MYLVVWESSNPYKQTSKQHYTCTVISGSPSGLPFFKNSKRFYFEEKGYYIQSYITYNLIKSGEMELNSLSNFLSVRKIVLLDLIKFLSLSSH